MSLILQFTDRAINIIKLSSEPGDKGKDVIVRSVTPEDLLGMLPAEEPKHTPGYIDLVSAIRDLRRKPEPSFFARLNARLFGK